MKARDSEGHDVLGLQMLDITLDIDDDIDVVPVPLLARRGAPIQRVR